jgi:lipopolysaccharide export system permease protein
MVAINRYILVEVLRPMAIVLVLALVVLIIERILNLLDLVLGASGPLKTMIEIIAYLVPHYMGLALPISLMLGVLIGFSRLSRDGELDALQSAGVGFHRLVRPALLAALAITVVAGITVGFFQPYGRYAYQSMVFAITNASLHTFLRAGVFAELGTMTVLIEGIQPEGRRFDRVFIYEDGGEGGNQTTITARDGHVEGRGLNAPPVFLLQDGVRLEIRTATPAPAQAKPDEVGVLRFDELRTELGLREQELFRARGKDEREFTLIELWQRRDNPPPNIRPADIIAELHGRIVRILSIPFLPLLAIPLALGRRRSDRLQGIVIGMVALVIYHNVLDFGENLVESRKLGPLLGLWLPFLVFASVNLFLFRRAVVRVPEAMPANLLDNILGWCGRRMRLGRWRSPKIQ